MPLMSVDGYLSKCVSCFCVVLSTRPKTLKKKRGILRRKFGKFAILVNSLRSYLDMLRAKCYKLVSKLGKCFGVGRCRHLPFSVGVQSSHQSEVVCGFQLRGRLAAPAPAPAVSDGGPPVPGSVEDCLSAGQDGR